MSVNATYAHTPGPWQTGENLNGPNLSVFSGGQIVADCAFPSDNTIAEANARVIAAAPDLLEVAIRCEQMVSTTNGPPDWDWIRSVIKKAIQP